MTERQLVEELVKNLNLFPERAECPVKCAKDSKVGKVTIEYDVKSGLILSMQYD